MTDCPYCSYDGDADEVYVHALGEHRDELPDGWTEIVEALEWLDLLEPDADVDAGRAEALAEDLERWSDDADSYAGRREDEDEANRQYGKADAFETAADEIRSRLLDQELDS